MPKMAIVDTAITLFLIILAIRTIKGLGEQNVKCIVMGMRDSPPAEYNFLTCLLIFLLFFLSNHARMRYA